MVNELSAQHMKSRSTLRFISFSGKLF